MKLIMALSIAFLAACTMGPSTEDRNPASAIGVGNYRRGELSNEKILKYSSTGNLGVKELRILTDNTEALESKIDIIRKAKSEIVLMYYIFSIDESSSYLVKELLAAANRNVKVKILVDFFVNYKNYDYFRMLEEKSRGNIQVSFYGVPAQPILKSLSYVTTPCEAQNKACIASKWGSINQEYNSGKVPFFTKLLVAGIYGKSSDLVKISMSEGAQIDLAGKEKLTEEEKTQLFDFLQLVVRAKVQGDVGAKLKLGMALMFYGKQTLPIYEKLLAALPFAGGDKNLNEYWDHSTDFIHHKLIMADNRYVQLGGRNVEDSYHMPASPSGKYTFLDTDVYAEVDGGNEIRKTYDRMWSFSDSVKPLKNLDVMVNHNFSAPENMLTLVESIKKCYHLKETGNYPSCIEQNSNSSLKVSMPQRMIKADAEVSRLSSAYAARNLVVKMPSSLTLDDANSFVTYIENLSFTRTSNKRLFGAGGEKNIHELWVQGIKNTCAEASGSKEPKEIILLNAYVFMPAALYSVIGDALTGKIKCGTTTFTIATNSIESTDLGVINMFANYQLMSLAKVGNNKVKIKILEMVRPAQKTTYSLHTKASILGQDIIIGSANADIRSYYMDSNNGFFIRNSPDLVKKYSTWVNDFINPAKGKFVDKTQYYKGLSFAQAQAINGKIMDMYLVKYGTKITSNTKVKIKNLFSETCADVYKDSQFFLSRQLENMDDRERQRVLKPRVESFDSKFQVL